LCNKKKPKQIITTRTIKGGEKKGKKQSDAQNMYVVLFNKDPRLEKIQQRKTHLSLFFLVMDLMGENIHRRLTPIYMYNECTSSTKTSEEEEEEEKNYTNLYVYML
jgi:hypothetical protein